MLYQLSSPLATSPCIPFVSLHSPRPLTLREGDGDSSLRLE